MVRPKLNPLHSVKRRRLIQTAAVIVISVLVALIILPLISRLLFFALSPFWSTAEDIEQGIHEEFLFIVGDKRKLVQENRDLKERVVRLEDLLTLDSIDREETYISPSGEEGVYAEIYSKPPASPYDTYLVNKGTRDQLEEGDDAYATTADYIVGFIEKVYPTHALVRSFSYPGFETKALLYEGMEVTLIGQGGGMFVVVLPMDVDVEKGRYVRYASEDTPVLGVVVDTHSNETEGLQRVYIRQAVSLSTQKQLLFLK